MLNKNLLILLSAAVILIAASVVFWTKPVTDDESAAVILTGQKPADESAIPGATPPAIQAKPIPTGAIVSPDRKYYITNTKAAFPAIVNIATGQNYTFKPGDHYVKVSNLKWSPNGKYLAYLYRINDANYANLDILNTIPTAEAILPDNFSQARRVLTAGAKMDYEWLSNNKVLFYQLLNKKLAGYYENASVGTYDVITEKFTVTLRDGPYLPNVYSLEFSPDKTKFIYQRAFLDELGKIIKKDYVIANLDGTIIKTAETRDPNWYH